MLTTSSDTRTDEQVVIAHGGGGEMTKRLIEDHLLPRLGNEFLNPLTDSAVYAPGNGKIVFTTDAFVVQPLEFPGGDIGRLAVCGTVNDLAVMGATPKLLSLALIIEEGLSLNTLDRIVDSISSAAREAGVVVATGDTKVVERQRGDGLTITTAGIGALRDDVQLGTERIVPGDVVIVTGRLAEHGLAVMSAREGMAFETALRSDVAPLGELVARLCDAGGDLKFLRDPTRGGLAGVLADLAEETGLTIRVEESALPISRVATHTSELLGLDPLTVANEGKCVVVVAAKDAGRVLRACRDHPLGRLAAVVAEFVDSQPPLVELHTRSGGSRLVQRPYGEELPRIC